MHIDISIPKFISASVTPASVHQTTKNAKSNLISPDAADVEPLKDATRSEVTKPLVKSPVQEAVVKTTECKDISMDIDDSDIFKTINSSSISTPSGISQMTGINSKLIEEIKFCEDSFPESKFCIYDLSSILVNILRVLFVQLYYNVQWYFKTSDMTPSPFPSSPKCAH